MFREVYASLAYEGQISCHKWGAARYASLPDQHDRVLQLLEVLPLLLYHDVLGIGATPPLTASPPENIRHTISHAVLKGGVTNLCNVPFESCLFRL